MPGLQASTAGDAVPAPGLIVTHTDELGLPAECSRGPIACTAIGEGASMPMWLGPEGLHAVQTLLRCGSTSALSARWRQLLVSAGLAVESSHEATPCWPPASAVAADGSEGPCTTFTPVAGMLHPFHLDALRLHIRRLLRLGLLLDGDLQTPLRRVQYNDPVTCWIHGYLAQRASQAAGTRVKPTYTYTIVYHDGADLPAHIDREQCEYTLSLCVDCLPEPPSTVGWAVPWPLVLETEAARVSVYQRIGDSLLFRGRHIRHSRPPLAAGLVVASILFHFVDDEYRGSLD
jgi:hypothetical protein